MLSKTTPAKMMCHRIWNGYWRLGNSLSPICLSFAFACGLLSSVWAQSPEKIRIAFIGDSIADGYWDGVARLIDQDACLRKRIELLRLHKDSTGLVRTSKYDWANQIGRIDARFKPRLFVLSVGANDQDADDKYNEKIDSVLDSVAKTEAYLLWVGLPAMRSTAEDKDARGKNRLFEQRITQRNSQKFLYVPSWRLKEVEDDKFSSYGPDRNHNLVQIRTADGVHFTPPGNLMTGGYLLPKIIATIETDGRVLCGKAEAEAK